MSAWQAIREAPRRIGQAAGQARPHLRGLPRPTRRLSTAWFAALMVGILVLGTVGQLFFITYLQSQAFEVRQAQRQAAELGYEVSDLEARVFSSQSPSELARRATNLGMVPNAHGVFIDLSTGSIIGDPVAARSDDLSGLLVRTQVPTVAAQPEAAATEQAADTTEGTADGASTDTPGGTVGAVNADPAAEGVTP